jgi:hypothetical protein
MPLIVAPPGVVMDPPLTIEPPPAGLYAGVVGRL